MKVLDLFSGIGGFSLGLERAGMDTVAFCEIEEYPRKVLAKHWPDVPIYGDIRTLTAEDLPDDIGLICGGYPCQPFSQAGKRGGEEDDRHLWPEMYRIIRTVRPRWVIAENVAGHITMGLDAVLSDLESAGYTCWTFVIPACAVGAHHRRDRVWTIAYSDAVRFQKRINVVRYGGIPQGAFQGGKANGIHAQKISNTKGDDWEITAKPLLCGTVNGIPSRVDRLKGLGNAVVPQVVEMIGRGIMVIENE